MTKSWPTTKLVSVGAIAVLSFIVHIAFYYSILVASGSALAGILGLVIGPFFLTLAVLIADQFWAGVFYLLIEYIITLPAPNLLPPLVNLIAVFTIGLPTDFSYKLLSEKHKLIFAFAAGSIYNINYGFGTILIFYTMGLPLTQNLPKFLTSLSAMSAVAGVMVVVGGLCGLASYLVYKKISNTSVVRRIQGS